MGMGAALTGNADWPPRPGRRRVSARPADRRHKQLIQHHLQLTAAANEDGHRLSTAGLRLHRAAPMGGESRGSRQSLWALCVSVREGQVSGPLQLQPHSTVINEITHAPWARGDTSTCLCLTQHTSHSGSQHGLLPHLTPLVSPVGGLGNAKAQHRISRLPGLLIWQASAQGSLRSSCQMLAPAEQRVPGHGGGWGTGWQNLAHPILKDTLLSPAVPKRGQVHLHLQFGT